MTTVPCLSKTVRYVTLECSAFLLFFLSFPQNALLTLSPDVSHSLLSTLPFFFFSPSLFTLFPALSLSLSLSLVLFFSVLRVVSSGSRVFQGAVRAHVFDSSKLPSLPPLPQVGEGEGGGGRRGGARQQGGAQDVSPYAPLAGYEAFAEEILSYAKDKSPFSWGEIKEELRSEHDDIEDEELEVLGQWLGVKSDDSSVSFQDCT